MTSAPPHRLHEKPVFLYENDNWQSMPSFLRAFSTLFEQKSHRHLDGEMPPAVISTQESASEGLLIYESCLPPLARAILAPSPHNPFDHQHF